MYIKHLKQCLALSKYYKLGYYRPFAILSFQISYSYISFYFLKLCK